MRLLILENDPATLGLLERSCASGGFDVAVVATQEQALPVLMEADFFAAFLADHLLGVRPFNLADYIRLTRPSVRLVVFQGPIRIDQTWESDMDWIVPRPERFEEVQAILADLTTMERPTPPSSELVFARKLDDDTPKRMH